VRFCFFVTISHRQFCFLPVIVPNSRLDLRIVERSIKALFSTEQDGEESTFAVISAFDAPKWKYDEATRLFIRSVATSFVCCSPNHLVYLLLSLTSIFL
jgi:hypothetical protein